MAKAIFATSRSLSLRGFFSFGRLSIGTAQCLSTAAAVDFDPCTYEEEEIKRNSRFKKINGKTSIKKTSQHCDACTFVDDQQLPPQLPKPKYSFYKRLLPRNLVALTSKRGRQRFLESLSSGNAEAYLPLAEQFLNQSDPAYCGVTTLAMILNACAIDPNVRWRGGWRWYGSDDVVLDRCCLGSENGKERVRRAGIHLEEFAGLGQCQGLRITTKRPSVPRYNLEDFRRDVVRMVQMPPSGDDDEDEEESHEITTNGSDCDGRGFLVVSFSRPHLNQTGLGHFSPIAAYHPDSDSCLLLDVARFKYSPYWVSLKELYDATKPLDESTGKSRGWFIIQPPKGIQRVDEGMRPADAVRHVGTFKEEERNCLHNLHNDDDTCSINTDNAAWNRTT